MLNRRQLRIKALEVVYAYDKSIEKNIDFQIKYFLKSNHNFFKLYITCFSLIKELYRKANELNSESDLTSKYLNDTNISFENDKSYITNLYRKTIASNKKLYEFFEDNEISWINDLPLINSLVLSSLKNNNKNSNKIVLMKDIYKNKEDADFGVSLIKKVIENKESLEKEISNITLNWDNDRIAQIDLILLQMCLSEFLYFKSIPVKVSINEYLEIAKEYSSKKSNVFINGILDKLSKNLMKEGSLKKNKRGLQ